MLAKSKLNSIETLISQALTDMEISLEEFIKILKEKDKYEKMKDNLRTKMKNTCPMTLAATNVQNMRLSSTRVKRH